MNILYICSPFFALGLLVAGTEAWFTQRRKDCTIPRGSLYDRATFRLQYGNRIDPLARGETVGQYNKVVVICKKDILTDVAMNYHVTTCHRGRWNPKLPACADPKNCHSLRQVENAALEVLLGNTVYNPHGTVVRYTCNEGYSMEGNSDRHCVNGEWTAGQFTCTSIQRPRNCSPLRPVENASQTVRQGNTVDNPHGTVVRYTCNEGYSLEGNNERHCVNGVWSDVQFTCTKIQRPRNCSPLRQIENASQTVRLGNTVDNPHGTVVRYMCNEGYSMEGNNERHCVNGVWSDVQFTCSQIQRPRNCSPLRPVENASQTVRLGNTVYNPHGTVVRYTCNEGYSMEGNNERHCVNGIWSDVQFTCTKIQQRCESLQDKFQLVNDIGSVSNFQNGSVVRLRCRWSWFPKDGIREATCINGEWKPQKPYCIVVCKIPNRPGRAYKYLSSGETVSNRVANGETVVQSCLIGPANPRKSTCMNGRWRPPFKFCPTRRRLGRPRSYSMSNCTVPDNPMAIYVDEYGDRLGPLEMVPNGAQLVQVCGEGGAATVVSEANSSFCHAGRWLPEFQNCSNNSSDDPETEIQCGKPDIKFATIYPDLDGYYIGETVITHCHNKGEVVRENITCLESGEWSAADISCDACANRKPDVIASGFNYYTWSKVKSEFVGYLGSISECALKCVSYTNFSCQSIKVFKYKEEDGSVLFYCKLLDQLAEGTSGIFHSSSKSESAIYNVKCGTVEETKHCLQPKKAHMVYWPVKQLYEVNDTLTILNCGDGLVRAGSREMRCSLDGTWEGDFECLAPCKDGKPDLRSSRVNAFDRVAVAVKHVGWLGSVSECARHCVSDRNFSCQSVQVITREEERPNEVYCKLLDELADEASDKFEYFEDPRQNIYNVKCDDSCILPADEEITFTDLDGRKLAGNGSVPDGATVGIACKDRQKTKKETVTCIAGKWNSPYPFCT